MALVNALLERWKYPLSCSYCSLRDSLLISNCSVNVSISVLKARNTAFCLYKRNLMVSVTSLFPRSLTRASAESLPSSFSCFKHIHYFFELVSETHEDDSMSFFG